MTDPAPAIPLDEAGRLAEHVECVNCTFDLMGRRPDAVCPECGAPVRRSVGRGRLAASDPAWVDRLASGAAWVMGGAALLVVRNCSDAVLLGVPVARTIATALLVVGIFRLTTGDPDRPDRADDRSRRAACRLFALGSLGLGFVYALVGGAPDVTVPLLGLTTVALHLGTVWLLGAHLIDLAGRIPDPGLARSVRRARWLLVVAFASLLAISGPVLALHMAQLLGPPAEGGTGGTVTVSTTWFGRSMRLPWYWTIPALIAVVAMLVGLFWSMRIIWRFRTALRAQAALARTPASD